MNAVIAEWVEKAKGDFHTAQRELRARRAPNYDAACFHSQQCAEKYLKAFLVLQKIEPPRSHNLVELLKLCVLRDGSFELVRPALEALNTFAVNIRYPGEFATKEEARDAVRAMKQVQDFVRTKIGK
jgi:HEPN domain-containing protein